MRQLESTTGRDVTIARFIVCTFLDSAIMQTPWGGQDVWAPRSLLRTFHDKASGLEVFLQILDRLRQDPKRYIDLLELQYVCLALGLQTAEQGHDLILRKSRLTRRRAQNLRKRSLPRIKYLRGRTDATKRIDGPLPGVVQTYVWDLSLPGKDLP